MPSGQKTNIFFKGNVNIFSVLSISLCCSLFECYSKKINVIPFRSLVGCYTHAQKYNS